MRVSKAFSRLVCCLRTSPRDYCLFFGAGASVDSGAKDATAIAYEIAKEIYQVTFSSNLDLTNVKDVEKLEEWFNDQISFAKILEKFAGDYSRRDIIRNHVRELKPSVGYEKLAVLIKNGFFSCVFTTNFDNLLEKALQLRGLVLNSDFEVLIIGKDNEEVICSQLYDVLRNKSKTFPILKLHGDLSFPITLKITRNETRKFPEKMLEMLVECFSKFGIIFVGYGGKDRDIVEVLNKTEKIDYPHWWVSKTKISEEQVLSFLKRMKIDNNILWDENGFGPGLFDDFFIHLNDALTKPNMSDFLDKIKKPDIPLYNKIDTIFVPPNEYDYILECLEKNKVVFLVGDPEIGKTFTAIRIMWEYYCKGYTPVWHSGSEFSQRMEIRQKMIDAEIQDHSVVYFEDPFGKIKFEDREELRREIGSFLVKVQTMDAVAIITSREEPFKDFEKEKTSESDLRDFAVLMNLMKPSYSNEKKKKILLNWAAEFDCKWLKNEALKSFIVGEGTKKLQTPLSMRDFALASKDCLDLHAINNLIKEKSKETWKAFAEEIANMEKEKALFLAVVYILRRMEPEKIKRVYDELCKKFGLNLETNSFDFLKEWFEAKVAPHKDDVGFEFAHPSYEEGVVQSWNKTQVKNFVLKVLNGLIEDDDPFVRGFCGFALVSNFDEISFKEEAKRLIDVVLHDKNYRARAGIAYAVYLHFDRLPLSLGLRYLEYMSKDKNREIRAQVVNVANQHFDKIPREESLKFTSRGLEDRAAYVRLAAIDCVKNHVKKLPDEIVRIALKRGEGLCEYSGWFIRYFGSIIYGILRERAEKLK